MSINKVLLVSGSANFSTRDVWDGYRIGLQVAGVEVLPYPTFSMLKVLSTDTVCSEIIGTALDVNNRIDCVIFIDGLYFRRERSRVPMSIKRAGIPTVLIATDDPYELMGPVSELYHYRFSNEITCAEDGDFYLPTATVPTPELSPAEQQPYDLSFVGTVFDDRLPFLVEIAEHCEQESLRMLVAGKFVSDTAEFQKFDNVELRSRTIDAVEKWQIYSQSKVTLNLFRESEQPAESPSPRVFEVTAFGQCGLLTGPVRSEVKSIFGDNVYHFDDIASAKEGLQSALASSESRFEKVSRAKEITYSAHLYHHRAEQLMETLREVREQVLEHYDQDDRLAWIIGYGRSGSTWLAEMLGDLPRIKRWHEPYFGRIFRHLTDRPEEAERPASFFSSRYQHTLAEGAREFFFKIVAERFPTYGQHALFVKEVNTPELYPWIRSLFPGGKLVFLARDPFDTLDSYLDLQRPGSWNPEFGSAEQSTALLRVERTCEHIRSSAMAAIQTFEAFPETQRLRINYEDMLTNPVPALIACGDLVSIEVKRGVAREVADFRAFNQLQSTGPGQFRRKGKAGVWKESPYFTPEVIEIAQRILGPVRTRLGYSISDDETISS